jgi:hypothetical protein
LTQHAIPADIAALRAAYGNGLDPAHVVESMFDAIVCI